MSPSTVPSTWISPVVFILPVTCKSADKIDAGGFVFGGFDLYSDDFGAVGAVPTPAGDAASKLGLGSLILFLENIVCCLDIDHRVNRFIADANFIMQMHSSCST